jgi:O-antigen ligase
MKAVEFERRAYPFSILLALVLVTGICLAWSPGFWAVSAAQAGVLLLAIFWVSIEKQIHASPEWIVIALVSFWGVFQIASGQTISSWWTMRASTTWISAGISFFVASQVLRRRENREVFLSVVLWSGTALALIAILQMCVDPGRIFGMFPAQPGSVGTFLYKNQFAAMLEIVAPVALYRVISSPSTRYAGLAAYTVLFAAGVASVSRAGVILLVAELVVVLFIAFRLKMVNWRKSPGALVLVVVVLIAGAAIGGPQALWDHFQEKDTYGIRHNLLKATLQMAADRPWDGFGMGTFHVVYPAYARFDPGVFVNTAHSDWAEWAAEGGFPFAGLIAALLLMVSTRAVRSVWGIGVLAVALHSIVDYPAREPTIALTYFAIVGALTGSSEKPKSAGGQCTASCRTNRTGPPPRSVAFLRAVAAYTITR